MRRISVIRNERIVPLFPAKPTNSKNRSPLSGLIVETHALGAVEFPEHEHSSLCLSLLTSGPVQQEWWSNGKSGKESLWPGSMMLVTTGTRHRTYMNRPSRHLHLSIENSYLFRAAEEMGTSCLALENRSGFADRQLHLLMSEFQREMESGWETGAAYQEYLGLSVSVVLIRKYSQCTSALPCAKGGMTRVRLQRVLDYIEANAKRDITLTDIAEVAALSRFHFARVFHQQMGVTPHQYVMGRRLERAKSLLKLDKDTLADIALDTGFTSAAHFSRAFRRYMGVAPTEWKRQI